jgi:FtsH-binding integral membrane protein
MKCATHPDIDAVGVCVNCGRAVCPACRTVVGGKTYCPACATGISSYARGNTTSKPVAGGILGIIAGVLGLLLGVILIAGGSTTDYSWESVDWSAIGIGIAAVVFGIMAIIGSSFAVARKNFTVATIGGVCALVVLWPLGLPALILIAISRGEFQPSAGTK